MMESWPTISKLYEKNEYNGGVLEKVLLTSIYSYRMQDQLITDDPLTIDPNLNVSWEEQRKTAIERGVHYSHITMKLLRLLNHNTGILARGIVPVSIEELDGKLVLTDGNHRCMACRLLGFTHIWAYVKREQ